MGTLTHKHKITIAHSPDADDAFMFWALATGKIDTEGVIVEHQLKDIQALNELALEGRYEVTALSFAAYPDVQNQYALLTTGASFGERDYGPIVVQRPVSARHLLVGVPGTRTTAFLLLKLWNPHIEYRVFPFDQILSAVVQKKVDAGLLIHEGQLTFKEMGLKEVIHFGRWWFDQYRLPLPLGGNVVRRDLPKDLQEKISGWIRASIEYGLKNRTAALDYALKFTRGLHPQKADRFVGMYVNERTLDMGEEGKKAIQTLLDLGYKQGLLSKYDE